MERGRLRLPSAGMEPVDEGWTDLHLHPRLADWSLELAELPGLLEKLGVSEIGCVVAHTVEDIWDAAPDLPPPLCEETGVPIAELLETVHLPAVKHVSCLLAPHDCGFSALADALRIGSRQLWDACMVTVGWGRTTLPDIDFRHTAASFCFSVAVSGPGLPAKPDKAAKLVPEQPEVLSACERLGGLIGTDCVAHMCFGET